MPLQFIIDAYNTINHTAFTPIRKKTKDPKRALLELIKKRRLTKKSRSAVTIVFDGYPNASTQNLEEPGINIIFSRGETADALIKRIVEAAKTPRNIMVVSDDREVRFFAGAAGSTPVAVEEFIHPRERPEKGREELIKTELNYTQISKINEELKALWLNNKSK